MRDPVADFHRFGVADRLAVQTAARRRGNALATASIGNAIADDPRTHGVHVTCSGSFPWSR